MDFFSTAILQGLGYAAMAIGIYISLRIFNIPDITTDGSYTLGGVVGAVAISGGMNPWLVLPLLMICGALAGVSSGLIHTRLKVNPLLSGILVMTALYSINLSIMGRSNLPLIGTSSIFDTFSIAGNHNYGVSIIMIGIPVILIIKLTWLLKTDFGLAMRATGNSEQMIRAMGVNTGTMKVLGLALANALTALSGYLLVQYQGYADINMGIGIVISGLAAVMIGESLTGIFKSSNIFMQLFFVVVGSIIFRLILAFALSLGLDPNYLKLVTALIVLIVVALTRFKKTAQ